MRAASTAARCSNIVLLWSGTNCLTDRYGGATIKERSRFASEVVAAIRGEVGPDFPIILGRLVCEEIQCHRRKLKPLALLAR
nr:hypothetical protein [Rhizobium leguminosarum]